MAVADLAASEITRTGLMLTWSDDPVSGYTYEVTLDGGLTWTLTGESVKRYEATGLEPGRNLRIAVRPVTAEGTGDATPILPITIPTTRITVGTHLLLGQWRNAENLKTLIDIGIEAFRERIEKPHQRLRAMGRIDDAEGVWLDYLGRRYGIERPYTNQAGIGEDERFGFDDAGVGWDQAPFRGDAAHDAVFPLPDPIYRKFVRSRAILVVGDNTFATFERSALAIDPRCRVADNHDMSLLVVTHLRWQFELADRIGALARNGGVKMIIRDRGRFGFDAAGVGFDQGPFGEN